MVMLVNLVIISREMAVLLRTESWQLRHSRSGKWIQPLYNSPAAVQAFQKCILIHLTVEVNQRPRFGPIFQPPGALSFHYGVTGHGPRITSIKNSKDEYLLVAKIKEAFKPILSQIKGKVIEKWQLRLPHPPASRHLIRPTSHPRFHRLGTVGLCPRHGGRERLERRFNLRGCNLRDYLHLNVFLFAPTTTSYLNESSIMAAKEGMKWICWGTFIRSGV